MFVFGAVLSLVQSVRLAGEALACEIDELIRA